MARGFTLPAILVVVGALLILAVGALLIVGIERNTSRAFSDRERANLAARAGLEDVKGILAKEAANDDFLILQGQETKASGATKDPAPYLYLARGSGGGDKVSYRYVPLFSAETTPSAPTAGSLLAAPDPSTLTGTKPKSMTTLPWYDPANISWISIINPAGKQVARYAYWVEDMQGKVDATVAGNADGIAGLPARAKFPDPPSKPVAASSPPLSTLAVHVLDPKATEEPASTGTGKKSLTQLVIDGRPAMLSPDSIIGATAIIEPTGSGAALPRNQATGLLIDPTAAALERETSPVNKSYLEQPVVPFSAGLSANVTGKPKKNLNKLLSASRTSAVDDMAAWIESAMPDFKDRKGGFPASDDYVKTLAAGAMDYADADSDPTVAPGSYVGLDAYPVLSEIVLHIDFLGAKKVKGRNVLSWRFKLFAELWNMTNKDSSGDARLTYEVNLLPETNGATGSSDSKPFDDPSLLDDRNQSTHNLDKIDGVYYTKNQKVTLRPDEYKFYEFATVDYTIDYVPELKADGTPKAETFDLKEPEKGARGITLQWNNQPVHRIQGIVRDSFGLENFVTTQVRKAAKAAIPGHSYGPSGVFINNMGDPRISHYLRTTRLGENAYPENISPGRRNIRRASIYDKDTTKQKYTHYGRVLPSEWPDGGHDSPTGAWTPVTSNAILPTNTTAWPAPAAPLAENAPQRISNLGRFYSATELGRIYDPVLWKPAYKDLKGVPGSGATDTQTLIREKFPEMPGRRNSWPDVSLASTPSSDYGGGNTLRIGRPEHPMFDKPGKRAAQLLDLFHAGIATSENIAEREGDLVEIKGNININTAGKDALRTMAAGLLQQDPELRRVTSWDHEPVSTGLFRPKTTAITLGSPTITLVADQIADALMLRRPFSSASEMASILNKDDIAVFGNRELYTNFKDIQWSDAAAEELFSRVYDASTVRSRNFRIWVIGQALAGTEAAPEILAESRKVFTVFADPGVRNTDGTIDPTKFRTRVTYENDF
jgi:type II secretory pathway pseudopilin PulG